MVDVEDAYNFAFFLVFTSPNTDDLDARLTELEGYESRLEEMVESDEQIERVIGSTRI